MDVRGHWDNDEIVVEHIVEGDHQDKWIDTGFWEEGLFTAPAQGETVEQAEAALRAEYES